MADISHIHTLEYVRTLVRWDAWYDSKIPLFFVCMYYAAISHPSIDLSLVGEMAILLFCLCLYSSFGHIVNSFSDRSIDLVAGKMNAMTCLSAKEAQILVVFVVITSLVTIYLIYFKQPVVMALFYLAFAIAAFYSLPPIRFKERGMLGLFAPAIAQRTLPAMIIFQAMEARDSITLAICVLSTLIGFRCIIVHQIRDETADLRANVRTVATTMGSDYLRRLLMKVVFPLELVTLITTVFIMSMNLPVIGVIAVIYAIWLALQVILLNRMIEKQFSLKSYIESYSVFSEFYYLYWPLLLSALLIVRNNLYWIVFIFTIVWLLPRIRREIIDISHAFPAL